MNFYLINKNCLIILTFFIFSSCSTKSVYEKLRIKKQELPIVENFDDEKIILYSVYKNKIDFKKKIILRKIKNKKIYSNNVIIENNKIFVLNNNIELLEFDHKTGELISSKILNFTNIKTTSLVSFNFINNSFLVSFKSGLILRLNMNGEVIWKFDSFKTLNTPLRIFNNQLILLYMDELKSLSLKDGSEIWSELYEDLPIYQAKGGQLVNILNLLFFILPNNKIGSFDLNLGLIHNSNFDTIPLINSINNTEDKIHIFKNYITYLDEGKYLYTFDIFKNNFLLFKKDIDLGASNTFFSNSMIIKNGTYLQSINIINSKTFWLINDKNISKTSSIIASRNIENNIEIFLDNGQVLIINNKKLIEIKKLDVGKIKNIIFENKNIIVNTLSGKIIIF